LSTINKTILKDVLSGFSVSIIALPLCLGIAMASGFPPIAGILTAIIGGIVATFLSNAAMIIKGPGAGLIAIAIGAVSELGNGDNVLGYKMTLACIVISGLLQIIFGIFKAGRLGDFFPTVAVHGMLAAIGIIIITKQINVLLGAKSLANTPFGAIIEIPTIFLNLNPKISFIGFSCLIIMFIFPFIKGKLIKKLPAPLLALCIAIPLGYLLNIYDSTSYTINNRTYDLGSQFLVNLPKNITEVIQFPDFSGLFSQFGTMIKFILMFSLVGTIESILTCKAIDAIDDKKRKTNLDKDITAIGICNTLCGLLGGLPMISEVVRSTMNKNNGAKTKWSNFYHGVFLLVFVFLLSGLIHHIPLSALAALLIYTGFRLAAPSEFIKTYKKSKIEFFIFIATIIMVLLTDLLIGLLIGVILKLIIHIFNGLKLKDVFKIRTTLLEENDGYKLIVHSSAIFSNLISFKSTIQKIPKNKKLIIDFETAIIVDSSTLHSIKVIKEDYEQQGYMIEVKGLKSKTLLAKSIMNTAHSF